MVVGGLDTKVAFDTTELISLEPQANPVPNCWKAMKPFPPRVGSPIGGILNGS